LRCGESRTDVFGICRMMTPEIRGIHRTGSNGLRWPEQSAGHSRSGILKGQGEMTKIAAVYARYSTDLQNDQSVEDQITYCRELAKRHGFTINDKFIFFDRAKSATTMFERDGLLSLMKAAKERCFQVVISEHIDRVSRDEEDLQHIYKRLDYNQIKIWTPLGEITKFHITVSGLIGAQTVKDTADKVRRHHDARVKEGKIPGVPAYGHRCVPGKSCEKEIEPEEAKIVGRIFTENTVLRKSKRDIAQGLTSDGIPNPSGGAVWNHQCLNGILSNPIYVGKLRWNTTHNVRNPDNGKVIRRVSKPGDIIEVNVPHLKIIDQSLWDRTQALTRATAEWRFGPGGKRAKKRTSTTLKGSLLSGLLICGKCGGQMCLTSSRRLVVSGGKMSGPFAACSAAHYHRTCDHGKSYDVAKLERVVLGGMKVNLTNPSALVEATKAYHARWSELQNANRVTLAKLQAELTQLESQINRVVDTISDVGPLEPLKIKLKALEARRVAANENLKLVELETNVVTLHPAAIDRFRSDIEQIHAALSRDLEDETSRISFRNVFERFVVHPTPRRADYEVTPYARLSAVMGLNLFPKIRTPEEIVKEQRLTGTDLAGEPTRERQNWTSDLICLGRWRPAA
jgi:site-specific DNA recombinase